MGFGEVLKEIIEYPVVEWGQGIENLSNVAGFKQMGLGEVLNAVGN